MGTSVERTTNVSDLSELGASYHMPSFNVDGMSCEAVHLAIEEACDRARRGDGPTLLNIKTYRYKGHSMSDPMKYRTKEEVEEYKAKDPIEQVLATIKKNKWMSEKEIEAAEERANEIVNESVKFAEESPYPDPAELYDDIYKEENYPYIIEY